MDEPEQPQPRRIGAETLNAAVQTLAILGAGAWAVYTFIYEAKVVPGLAPPTVSVTSALEKAGEKGDLVAVRSTVTRNNVGQTGVRLLGLTYNVVGVKVRFGGQDSGAWAASTGGDLARAGAISAAKHYEEAGNGEVILRQGALFEGASAQAGGPSHLNPGETVSRDFVFYVDRARFDSVRFLVSLSYNKLSEPPVPLAFAVGVDERLAAVPGPGCGAEPRACAGLTTTDFGTELSLW